jgi:hypothetical protein
MDTSSGRHAQSKAQRRQSRTNSKLFSYIADFPLRFMRSLGAQALALLRPTAPQLIPAFIFLFFVPLAVFFSLSAGWIVWRSVAVGWDSSIYLQYG